MVPSDEKLELYNIGSGAAAELFDIQLSKVLNNIMDINTVDGSREINLKFKLQPNDRRDEVGIDISCSSRLGAVAGFKTAAKIGRGYDGRPAANEILTKQKSLFDNVTELRKEDSQHD